MTREEEIFKAARSYISGDTLSSNLTVIHFANGAKWADEHPNLAILWHDESEEPQGKYYIVCQDTFENVFPIHSIEVMTYHQSWEKFVMCECIVRWAYVKDLFPKGGKK